MPTKVIQAEFGRVAMLRAMCPMCNSMALVLNGRMACCGADPYRDDSFILKKEAEGEKKRKGFKTKDKAAALAAQGNRCFYCDLPFGTPVWHPRRHKVIYQGVHFDHFVCWDYSRNTSAGNLVAACSVCNLIKSNKLFANAADARAFIKHRRLKKGYETLESLPDRAPEE